MNASLFPGLITVAGLLIVLAYAYYTLYEVKKLVRRDAEQRAAAKLKTSHPHPAE
ncbi:MAG TPA: hypothetical protein VIN06_13775 [Devosia sp.]